MKTTKRDPSFIAQACQRAFKLAEKYRQDKDPEASPRVMVRHLKRGDGPARARKRVGPGSYKVTFWLAPWEYVELVEQAGKQSVTRYLKRLFQNKAVEEKLKRQAGRR